MKGRDYWDLIALGVFLGALGGSLYILFNSTGWMMLLSLSFFDFAIVALAAFRLLHLITYDKVFAFIRNYFDRRGKHENKDGGYRYIDGFLECIWCTGVWSGLVTLTLYCVGLWGQFIVLVLAVAGVASLLQLASLAFAKKVD
jgi:hypothetical protein